MENTKIKKSVRIRLAKEAAKQHKEENAGHLGATSATLRNIPTPPRKMRLVADMIRGVRVEKALAILKHEPKIGARHLEKLLTSAISNWENRNSDIELEDANLVIKTIFVDAGRTLKRLRPAPQGRAHRIRKRSNHVTIILDSESDDNNELEKLAADAMEQIENVVENNNSENE